MPIRADALQWLMDWYEGQCDGDWEHSYGVRIDTIDNPGWSLKIELTGTRWSGQTMDRIQHNYDHDTEWWTCWTEKDEFHGAGGPKQLSAIISTFREWSAQHSHS
ncbi:MAG: immunity 53 family protein [Pseudomonadota bacterium]